MKKILSGILALILCAALTGCGGGGDAEVTTAAESATEEETTVTETKAAKIEAYPFEPDKEPKDRFDRYYGQCVTPYVTPNCSGEYGDPRIGISSYYFQNYYYRNFDTSAPGKFTVGGVSLYYHDESGEWVPIVFKSGKGIEYINQTVYAGEEGFIEITDEMLDYSSLKSGKYKIVMNVVNVNSEYVVRDFYLNAEDLPTEEGVYFSREMMDFLDDEQYEVFKLAYEYTNRYFGLSTGFYLLPESITTGGEFIDMLSQAYTREYAKELAIEHYYLDENGNFQNVCADGSSDITFVGVDFVPVSVSDNEIIFNGIETHFHADGDLVSYEEIPFHMVKTEDGWRFDVFTYWC